MLPPSLYDVFLEAVQFDSPEEVLQRVTYHLGLPPGHSNKAKRALSHVLAPIVRLRKHDLLELLFGTLLEHGVSVDRSAMKEAVALPFHLATVYLDMLFALGWDVNTALSNTEPPILSMALENISLTHWLLRKGADPNAPCDIDYTSLSVAVKGASFPVIRLLLRHARYGRNGHLVFHATQRTNLNEAKRLIRLLHQHGKPIDEILYQDERSYHVRAHFLRGTPLYYACKNGRLPVALTLLELGADPDKACVRYNERVGPSPREVAADYGWSIFGTSDNSVELPKD